MAHRPPIKVPKPKVMRQDEITILGLREEWYPKFKMFEIRHIPLHAIGSALKLPLLVKNSPEPTIHQPQ